jgi:putative transposase
LDAAARRCRFCLTLEPNQKRIFPRNACGAIEIEQPVRRRESGIWQRRFWEHTIRNDADFERHVDYIHFNPVKHGYVTRVRDWPFSSFHRYVKNDLLPADWGGNLAEIEGRFGE